MNDKIVVSLLRVVNITRGLMGHCSTQWRARIISGRLGLFFRDISQYILIAALIISCLLSITYYQFIVLSDHQFFIFILQLTPLLPCLHWPLINGGCLLAPPLSGVAAWCCNFTAAVCDTCQHSSPWSVVGMGLLMTTWCCLLPIFVIIDAGGDCCHNPTSGTSFLSSLCYWFNQCS